MKKETICIDCNKIAKEDYYCDTCENNLLDTYYGIPIEISFSYGHILDGSEYHFCNWQCLLQFILDEQKKKILT
jgi:hypothetical protein